MKSLLLALLIIISPPDKDIWNLPPLTPEKGKYTQEWDNLSRNYNVPEWWRDAKFGAWSHWDPQSAPEDGDWYNTCGVMISSYDSFLYDDMGQTIYLDTYEEDDTYSPKRFFLQAGTVLENMGIPVKITPAEPLAFE